MPPTLVEDPERLERLKRARRSAEYFQHNLEEIQALGVRYVVLLGDEIVGKGDSPEEAWESISEGGTLEGAVLMPVPQDDETFLF